jgi:hypothetical protein
MRQWASWRLVVVIGWILRKIFIAPCISGSACDHRRSCGRSSSCISAFYPITVVGGQTGTVGSAIPSDAGISLSLERMNRIIEIHLFSMTITVEAGCLLQIAQEEAEGAGCRLGAHRAAEVDGRHCMKM